MKAGVVALDGTKMKANASLSANRTQEHIEEEVRKVLAEARERDEEEDRLFGKDSRGDEMPEELKDRRSRLTRLKECREILAREKEEKIRVQVEMVEKRFHGRGKTYRIASCLLLSNNHQVKYLILKVSAKSQA